MRDRNGIVDLLAEPGGVAVAIQEAFAVRRPVIRLTSFGHPDAPQRPRPRLGTWTLADRQITLFTPLLTHTP
jgi:hypothetical protein